MKTCLIFKCHITQINKHTFNAELYNVIENTTKECAEFYNEDIDGDIELGKVFFLVLTEHGKSLQFMHNVSHEEHQEALKKATEQAKKWGRIFEKDLEVL